MGKKSRQILTCKVNLSITNQFYNNVVQNIKDSNFGKIIADKTNNNAKVIDEKWVVDRGILGRVNQTLNSGGLLGSLLGGPLTFVSGVSWTNATIIYQIDVDLYHLTKNQTNVVVAQLSKLCKKKRKKTIIDTMKSQIKDGFEDAIESSAGKLSSAVVTVKSVDIY